MTRETASEPLVNLSDIAEIEVFILTTTVLGNDGAARGKPQHVQRKK